MTSTLNEDPLHNQCKFDSILTKTVGETMIFMNCGGTARHPDVQAHQSFSRTDGLRERVTPITG